MSAIVPIRKQSYWTKRPPLCDAITLFDTHCDGGGSDAKDFSAMGAVLLALPLAFNLFPARAVAATIRAQEDGQERRVLTTQGNRRRRMRRDRGRHRGIRSAFKKAGKSAGRGGKRFGKNMARGRPVRAGKHLGKGMGGFGKHTGKGVGRTMRRVFKP